MADAGFASGRTGRHGVIGIAFAFVWKPQVRVNAWLFAVPVTVTVYDVPACIGAFVAIISVLRESQPVPTAAKDGTACPPAVTVALAK